MIKIKGSCLINVLNENKNSVGLGIYFIYKYEKE